LEGVIPILAMPFRASGAVDEESLAREVEWAIGQGVNGLGLALASELPRLSESEREAVTRICAEQARGRVPLIVNVSAESSHLAAELGRRAEAAGADALMLLPPVFEVSSPEGLATFYDEVLGATELPVVLQDVPGARIPVKLVATLATNYVGRLAFKAESPPTPVAVETIVRECGGQVPVFGGAAGLQLYSELLRGASGTMPGCAVPEHFVDVWSAFGARDLVAARKSFDLVLPFLTATAASGRILPYYRETLVFRGIFDGAHCRAPEQPLSQFERKELREIIAHLGVDIVSG
jgi:4-hydroxy-tetrahydrodipicolinate synthase